MIVVTLEQAKDELDTYQTLELNVPHEACYHILYNRGQYQCLVLWYGSHVYTTLIETSDWTHFLHLLPRALQQGSWEVL